MNEIIAMTRADLDATIRAAAQAAADAALSKLSSHVTGTDLWDAKQVGEYLNCSAYTVAYELAHRRGFPASINIGSGEKRPRRRWHAEEIREWSERMGKSK